MKPKQQPSIEKQQPERVYPATELGKLLETDDAAQQINLVRQLLQERNQPDAVITLRFNPHNGGVAVTPCGVEMTTAQIRQVLGVAIEALAQKEIADARQAVQRVNQPAMAPAAAPAAPVEPPATAG